MSHPSRRTFLIRSMVAMAAVGIRRRASAAESSASVPAKSPCPPRIPMVAGPFINIYKPQPDIFTLPTVKTGAKDGEIAYLQGTTYPDWRTNDHTFIKDDQGRWHCFGITRPWVAGDNGHTGEGLCFHAMAPEGTFAQTVRFQSWRDLPKIQVGDCGWAPMAVKMGQEYALIGSQLGRATSTDLRAWTDQEKLNVKGNGRDTNILFWNNTYHLLRCAGNGISLVTSVDFIHWTAPVTIYKPEKESYQTESPFLVFYEGLFYLFWTLWDTADKTTSGYCPRTYVHCSESPADFHGKPVLAEYTVHAPEIVQDEGGQWFMSTADHPHRGVSVAPLVWQ